MAQLTVLSTVFLFVSLCAVSTHGRNDVAKDPDLIYPPKMREDDTFGFFVRDNGITSKMFSQYERKPDEFEMCISSNKNAVVLFFQPWSVRSCVFLPYLPEIVKLSADANVDVSVCSANCKNYPELCEQYSVTVYPTVILFEGPLQWKVYQGVLNANQIVATMKGAQTPPVEEMTPFTLPNLLSKGKPLAILMLDGVTDDTALFKEFNPPADFVPTWLNYSLTQDAFKDVEGIYGTTVPALIVMDFTPGTTAVYRCKLSAGKALGVEDLKKCLKEIGQEGASSWEQPANLPAGQYPPLMKPIRFPSVGDNWELDSAEALPKGPAHSEL